MYQSSLRSCHSSGRQETYRTLWNQKVHCHIRNRHPLLRTLNHINPVHAILFSSRSILILFSHISIGLPSDLFPSGFPTNTLYSPCLFPILSTCPIHLIHSDLMLRVYADFVVCPLIDHCSHAVDCSVTSSTSDTRHLFERLA